MRSSLAGFSMSNGVFQINPSRPDPRMVDLLADYPADLFDANLYQSIELVEQYCLHLAIDILRRLGAAPALDLACSVDDLCGRLGLLPRFGAALSWLLESLAAAEHVSSDGGDPVRYRSLRAWPPPRMQELRARIQEIDSTNLPTLDLLDAAAAAYPRIARGETTGEDALLAVENIHLWLAYFNNGNPLYAVNNRVGAIDAVRRLTAERPLRILEIGAGACSGTECLLQELAGRDLLDRVERIVVTEPSAFFRRRGARSLTAKYPGLPIEFFALDIDASWPVQGAERGHFDLVFGVNVLHVAKDLPFSLAEAHASLASGGWLVIGECLRPFPGHQIYIELVFQILDSFVDVSTDPELRPRPGFLTPEEWRRSLANAGFRHIEVTPNHAAVREIYPGLFVGAVCAQRP